MLYHISQQLKLSYITCIPQTFRFKMNLYEPNNSYLEECEAAYYYTRHFKNINRASIHHPKDREIKHS